MREMRSEIPTFGEVPRCHKPEPPKDSPRIARLQRLPPTQVIRSDVGCGSMQLPPSSFPVAAIAVASGKDLVGENLAPLGLAISVVCLGLVAFSFLRRRPKKGKVKVDSEPIERVVEDDPAPPQDVGIDVLLSGVRYPLTERAKLVKALGGEDAEVEIGKSRGLPAGEVADRCFSISGKFQSKAHVLEALDRSSWITSVMSSVNMMPFPLRSISDAPRGLMRGYIEGVKVKDLVDRLEFPIENPSDLLTELSQARFERSSSADDDEGRQEDVVSQEAGDDEAEERSEPLVAQAQVSQGEEADAPEEVSG